ncbi:nicotinate-nucleotide--dimethylbenzimidazole phosphoribosyltransferase [Halorientalis salina]|uniref:nicotinate-nucleotide--dimethylbenzimidazole phosphoribosyltransferase n=1 Tax=Halorientalis salina TaxID=2932266 RepID=UPI0010AD8DD9|nr:nicotinate-nucleotide--dimethylbenzimidazole phosphoribosyltransferase [Halorientalis salina]
MRLVLVAGTTETAAIDGISAAGADPEAMVHTPGADAEIVTYGEPVRAPVVPVSPTGCPTPAVVTRAVAELLHLDVTVVDGGLAEPSGAPTVTVGARTGGDVREQDPVPAAQGLVAAARQFGQAIPDDAVYLAETIPGGTTTALGVLRALGEEATVSSSLPENPLELKESVVSAGLTASDVEPGGAAGEPNVALRRMGDPVLATMTGLIRGLVESDTAVTLAGGTQMLAAAAAARHYGIEGPISLATTSFVADDESIELRDAASTLDVDVTVTDPGFETIDHPATNAYVAGEAKEGVGMGGALALAEQASLPMADVRQRVLTVYDRLLDSDVTEAEP